MKRSVPSVACALAFGVTFATLPAAAQATAEARTRGAVHWVVEDDAPVFTTVQPRTDLIAAGAAVAMFSYALSAIGGGVFCALSAYEPCAVLATPFAGGYVAAGLWPDPVGSALGVLDSSVQLAGLAMLIAGCMLRREVPVASEVPRLGSGPGGLGLGLQWVW